MHCSVPRGRDEDVLGAAVDDRSDACGVRREDSLGTSAEINPGVCVSNVA